MFGWKQLAIWLQKRGAGRGAAVPNARRGRHRKLSLLELEDRTAPAPLTAGPVGLHATEGQLYDGAVTTFTDGNTQHPASDFTATISWGDGSSSPGTVTGSNGHFTVSGQHTYTEEGNFPLSVVITELDNNVSITAGGPPVWTPLAATLPPTSDPNFGPIQGRGNLAATAGIDGKIYAIGGRVVNTSGVGGPTDEVDAYDPATQTWAKLPSLPSGPRWSLSATTGTDGTIYVMGGLIPPSGNASSEFDAYNPATQTWTRLPDLPNFAGDFYTRQFYAQAATGTDGTIYAVGGFYTSEVDAYNPSTHTWTQVASLPSSRYFSATTTGTDGTIYSLGGVDSNTHAVSSEVDAYNPTTNTWSVLPPLPNARYALAAATGANGLIYVIGGAYANGTDTGEVDVYDPVTRTWTVLAQSMPNPREVLAAATGADGTIYAMGGQNRSWSNEVDTYLPPGPGANTATVDDAPLAASGTAFATPGVSFSGQTVATFIDTGGAEPVGHYSATIYWGDQFSPTAADGITYDPGTGQFSVTGSHTYPQVGNYTVSVSIQHETAPVATAITTAQIGSVRPTASVSGPTAGVTGQLLGFTIGATDPIPSLDAAGFAFSIDWGDGSQAATVSASAGNGAGVPVGHSFATGTYTVEVTATDLSGNTATASLDVTVTSATTGTTIGVSSDTAAVGQGVTFTATVGAVPPGAGTPTGTVTFSEGGVVIGTGTLQVVDGVNRAVFTTAALGVGGHTITAIYGGDGNYSGSASGGVSVTVILISTTMTLDVSASTPLAGIDAVDLQATVAVATPGSWPTGSVDFFDATTGTDLGSAPVVHGVAILHTGPLTAGPHWITATYSGDATFRSSAGTAAVNALTPASLSGTVFADFNNDGQVDFGEAGIGGVLVTLTGTDDLGQGVSRTWTTDADGVYIFLNLRPGSYYLTETGQPSGYGQGVDTVGTAGGQLSGTDQFAVALNSGTDGFNYNFGETPSTTGGVRHGQTAGIGFWNNKNGQALIRAFNGGAGHQLGDWLAATFVNLYGANSGNDLAGRSNDYIAALFQHDFLQKGQKLDAQVLATALSVYATNVTLDDTRVAAQYGFTVADYGVGTATVNVGADGAAFGANDGATMTVLDLLLAADARAVNGVLYGGDSTLRNEANDVFSIVNQAGAIG